MRLCKEWIFSSLSLPHQILIKWETLLPKTYLNSIIQTISLQPDTCLKDYEWNTVNYFNAVKIVYAFVPAHTHTHNIHTTHTHHVHSTYSRHTHTVSFYFWHIYILLQGDSYCTALFLFREISKCFILCYLERKLGDRKNYSILQTGPTESSTLRKKRLCCVHLSPSRLSQGNWAVQSPPLLQEVVSFSKERCCQGPGSRETTEKEEVATCVLLPLNKVDGGELNPGVQPCFVLCDRSPAVPTPAGKGETDGKWKRKHKMRYINIL